MLGHICSLYDIYFDIMTYFLILWRVSWCIFQCFGVLLNYIMYFLRNGVLFNIMTYMTSFFDIMMHFLMSGHNSWHYYIMTLLYHDILIMTYFPYFMIHVLTVWCSFWRHDIFLDVMTCFMTYVDVSCFNIHTMAAQNIIAQIIFFTFWLLYEKLVFKLFPLVVHMSPWWWGLHLLTFRCPWYPWILCKGPTWPRKRKKRFIFFILKLKRFLSYCFYIWHAN